MKLSLCLDPARRWSDAMKLARQIDTAGWYAVYQCDHFMPHDADGLSRRGEVTECWTTLSALATVTRHLRLGSLVLGNTYRHPALVASMAATLDRISEGRVVLGIGAGWQPNEHAAFGIRLPEPAERIDALDEACAVLRMLLDTGRCSYSGRAYQLRDATCEPRPVQQRLPLLVGGAGERRTMKVAARHADVWHCWADPSTFAAKNSVLDRHCETADRDPGAIARATGGTVAISPLPRHQPADLDHDDVAGTIDQVIEQLREFRAAGADEFIVRDRASSSLESTADLISALTSEALPAIAG